MNLYFKNSKGEIKLLCKANNRKAIMKEIDDFLQEHNYQSFYTRMWGTDNDELGPCIKIDVGSWTEFFYVQFNTPEDRDYFLRG